MNTERRVKRSKVLACGVAALKLKYRRWSAGNFTCTDFEQLCKRVFAMTSQQVQGGRTLKSYIVVTGQNP